MTASLTLTGDKQLDRWFEDLPNNLAKKGIRVATRSAAKIVLEEAKRQVPHDTGALEESLTVRVAKQGRRGRLRRGTIGHSVQTREGMFQGDTFYGGFVEFGTQKWEGDPFLRPALYGQRDAIVQDFRRNMQTWVRRQHKLEYGS